MKNRIKNMKGITLIALIITIIVLLILAGVVINMTLGNDGIISKAQGAVDAYKNAQEKEEFEIAKVSNEIDNYDIWERTGEKKTLVYLEPDPEKNEYTFTKNYDSIYAVVFRGPNEPELYINNVAQTRIKKITYTTDSISIYKLENVKKDDVLHYIGNTELFTNE